MFSQASVSVSHSVHGSMYLQSYVLSGGSVLWSRVPSGGGGGWVCPGVGTHPPTSQTWTGGDLLTPIGSHHTYGGQAGSTHPTGMLSCF